MSVIATVATVVGGGIAGSALTYVATWMRERRRTLEAYRAPQRAAIAGIVTATHQLVLRERAFVDFIIDLGNRRRGDCSLAELHEEYDQISRALFGLDNAFAIGRLTIVDPECFEAMGIAANDFQKIQTRFADIEMVDMRRGHNRGAQLMSDLVLQLKRHVADLVREGQAQLSPVQSWRHKRRQAQARARLEAKYPWGGWGRRRPTRPTPPPTD
jgi:hypothetical protein